MKAHRAKVLTWSVVAIATAILLALAAIERRALVVEWNILVLRWGDTGAQRAALAQLARSGSERALGVAFRIATENQDLSLPAMEAVERLVQEAGERKRAEVLETVRGMLKQAPNREWPSGRIALFRKLGAVTPSAFPLLTAEIRTGPRSPLFELAAVTLALGWPGSRVAIEEVFSGMSAGEAVVFFDALRGDQQNPGAGNGAFQGQVVELSGHLALHHRDAQVRAVALASLAGSPALAPAGRELEVLRQVYGADSDLTVLRAAIRIAGLLRDFVGNLDLPALICREQDPALLRELIEARRLWVEDREETGTDFEIAPDLRSPWPLPAGPVRPWSEAELERLHQLLRTHRDPGLRETASLVLGSWSWARARAQKLEVHEWGVWREGAFEPRITFHTPEPLPLIFRVSVTGGGGLQSRYPDAAIEGRTDRLEWCGLRVGYHPELEGPPRAVEPGTIWERARRVNAAPVAIRGETEGFLCYRATPGLSPPVWARFRTKARREILLGVPPLGGYRAWWGSASGDFRRPEKERERITCLTGLSHLSQEDRITGALLPAVLVIKTPPAGPARGRLCEGLFPKEEPRVVSLSELDLEGDALRSRLHRLLVDQGLTDSEAAVLLAEWDREFFTSPGLRLVTVLPRWFLDRVLPLQVGPEPAKLARVGLALTEGAGLLVADEAERLAGVRFFTGRHELEGQATEIRRVPLQEKEAGTTALEASGEISGWSAGRRAEARLLGQGSRAAFCRESDDLLEVFLLDLEAGSTVRLASYRLRPDQAWGPLAASADGRRIAFSVHAGGGASVKVIDLENRLTLEILAGDSGCSLEPSLSGDGRFVAYQFGDELRVVELDTGRTLTGRFPNLCLGPLSFSADRRSIALVLGAGRAGILDLETKTTFEVFLEGAEGKSPALSAGGETVIFESDPDLNREIYSAEPRARVLRNLTRNAGGDYSPSLSAAGGDRVVLYQDGSLRVLDRKTGALREVPGSARAWNPSLSSDGRRVLFQKKDGEGESALYLVALEN